MISNVAIAGMILATATCALMVALSGIVGYKYRGNAGGALMAYVFGFAAVMLVNSVSNMLFTLTGLGAQMDGKSMAKTVAAFLVYALVFSLVDFGVRYYILYYMDKTGIGKHKGISVGTGYMLGQTLPYVFNLLLRIVYAFAINSGTFVNENQAGNENYEAALQYQEMMIKAPANEYYVYALQFVAICAVQMAITLYMTRCWLENEKKKSSFVVFGATFAFEGFRQLINALVTGEQAVITDEEGFYICGVVFALVIAGCVFWLKKTLTDFPHGREKFVKTVAQVRQETAAKKKRVEWQQVNMLNAKNSAEEETEKKEDSEQ